MSAIDSMPRDALLAQINTETNARRRYELADGAQWHNQRHAYDACKARLEMLTAKWREREVAA